MAVTLFQMLGHDYFWKNFHWTYPNFPTKDIWYEVFIDFMEDEHEELQTLQYNLEKAKKYLETHKNDYD